MKTEPLVSIIMSLYNTPEKYLRESIESILNQTYTNFEFIIINDGTKDNGVEVIESYKDDRIHLYHNEKNMGLEYSLNRGIFLANSDYIVRMDTDDIAYPERIKRQMDFFINNDKYAMIGSRADLFNEDGIYGKSKCYGEIENDDLVYGPPFVHPTLIIKKHILEEIGGYPLYRRCEDYAMEFEIYSRGYKGYIIEESLLKYRIDKNSYKKKKWKPRVTSMKLRLKYYPKLNIRFYKYIFAFKPLFSGKLIWKIKRLLKKN